MNFMPSEDAFFDEPLNQPPAVAYVPPQVLSQHTHQPAFSHFDHLAKQENDHSAQLLESSRRQEYLLEKIVSELEKLNSRISNLERVAPSSSAASTSSRVVSPGASPTNASSQQSGPKQTRGSLVVPPGSRPTNIPKLPERKPVEAVSAAEDAATRERQEQEAILRRRADSLVRDYWRVRTFEMCGFNDADVISRDAIQLSSTSPQPRKERVFLAYLLHHRGCHLRNPAVF